MKINILNGTYPYATSSICINMYNRIVKLIIFNEADPSCSPVNVSYMFFCNT